MFSGTNISGNNQKLSLEQLWNAFNSNKAGDSANSIDKEEMLEMTGSVFFVEEGMTEQEFYSKNIAIYDAYSHDNSKLSASVSKLVKDIIANGEFEVKRDVILGKLDYLDAETRKLVEQEEDTYKARQETIEQLKDTTATEEETPEAPGYQ